jgi:hypothetical protein
MRFQRKEKKKAIKSLEVLTYFQQFMVIAVKFSLTIRKQLPQKPTTIPQCLCRYI